MSNSTVPVKRRQRKGRPPTIDTHKPQVIALYHCTAALKLQLIHEADEMDLPLSMYVCMALQGAGREVRKAAAMELAIELEQREDPTLSYKVTSNQISAFEAALLANPDEDEMLIEKEKAETEKLLSEISKYQDHDEV